MKTGIILDIKELKLRETEITKQTQIINCQQESSYCCSAPLFYVSIIRLPISLTLQKELKGYEGPQEVPGTYKINCWIRV